MSKIKIINQFDAALINTVKHGCDILNGNVANILVSLKERKPDLLEITEPMTDTQGAKIGVIATKKGLEELENYTFIYDLFDKHVYKKKKFKFTKKNLLILKRLGFEQQDSIFHTPEKVTQCDRIFSIVCHNNFVWIKDTKGIFENEK